MTIKKSGAPLARVISKIVNRKWVMATFIRMARWLAGDVLAGAVWLLRVAVVAALLLLPSALEALLDSFLMDG